MNTFSQKTRGLILKYPETPILNQQPIPVSVSIFINLSIYLFVSLSHTLCLCLSLSHSNQAFLVACTRLYTPLCPSVSRSVGWSVTFYFFMIFVLWPYCSCPNGLMTSNIAPAHPHTTGITVYPALFFDLLLFFFFLPFATHTAFAFWNDRRKNVFTDETNPTGRQAGIPVGFPSQRYLEQYIVNKEPPFETFTPDRRNKRESNMTKWVYSLNTRG